MEYNEIQNEYRKSYDKGFLNRFNRAWFYLEKGMEIVNKTKYVGAYMFAFYVTLKLDWIGWLAVMTIVAIPLLVIAGRYYTLKMSKAQEWNAMNFSSYFGRYGMDLQEEILKTLKEINENSRNRKI